MGRSKHGPAQPSVWFDRGVRLLLNVVWLIFGGFWLFLGYVLAGVLLCIPIITIPWAIASFRIAAYALWPFGRTVVAKPSAGVGSFIGNVIWFVLAGWWLAIAHIVSAVALAITIIGIPLALAVLLLYFLMLIVGYAAVGVIIGDAALATLRSQDARAVGWRVGAAMGAMLALALLTRIPYLGGLVAFVALMGGVGAIVLALKARGQRAAPAAA
jgi:uncharacterized membrane protein YccF (DUF307 family)